LDIKRDRVHVTWSEDAPCFVVECPAKGPEPQVGEALERLVALTVVHRFQLVS
jgi:hypothetical protein